MYFVVFVDKSSCTKQHRAEGDKPSVSIEVFTNKDIDE